MSRGARPLDDADVQATKWALPLTVLVVGIFMSVLDTDIVNVAVPTMQQDFGATTDQVQWVATIYTLALGIVVPASGWLGDRYGLDRIYAIALVAFAAGSALCGLAWSLNSLLFFRVVQAIGGGLMPAVSMAMLYKIVPPQRLGVAMGLFGLGVLFAPTVGPSVGGYLVEYVNWRLIFYINVPVGAVGLVAALMVLPKFPARPGHRFDFLGFATISVSLFSLLLALSEGADWGWSSYRVLGLFTVGALAMAIFVVVELSVAEPLLDVHVFRYGNFTNSLVLISVLMAGLFGLYFYIPLFLQEGEGLGALQAGLLLLLPALLTGLTMPFSGKLYDKIGARWPAAIGCLVVAYGTYLMRNVTPDTPRGTLVMWMCVRNIGMGIAFMPIMTSAMAGMPSHMVNRASAVSNIAQRVSSSFGLAVMTSLLTTQMAQQFSSRAGLIAAGTAADPHLSGMGMIGWRGAVQTAAFGGGLDDLFLVTAGVTALCALVAMLLPNGPVAGAGMMMEGGPMPAPELAEPGAVAAVATEVAEPEPVPAPRRRTTRRAHRPAGGRRGGHLRPPGLVGRRLLRGRLGAHHRDEGDALSGAAAEVVGQGELPARRRRWRSAAPRAPRRGAAASTRRASAGRLAPIGWPNALSPPSGLTGSSPSRSKVPASTSFQPAPRSAKPRSSISTSSVGVKQSWTSAMASSRAGVADPGLGVGVLGGGDHLGEGRVVVVGVEQPGAGPATKESALTYIGLSV